MSYAAVESNGRWRVATQDGGWIRVGPTLDEEYSPVLRLGTEDMARRIVLALSDGTMEPSGSTPAGDPVIDIDEYVPWLEDQ